MTKKQADKYIEKMDVYYNKERALSMIPSIQAQLYVMCGMEGLGIGGATQPTGFYIQTGTIKLPYNQKDIRFIARVLSKLIKIAGLKEPLKFNTFDYIGV